MTSRRSPQLLQLHTLSKESIESYFCSRVSTFYGEGNLSGGGAEFIEMPGQLSARMSPKVVEESPPLTAGISKARTWQYLTLLSGQCWKDAG